MYGISMSFLVHLDSGSYYVLFTLEEGATAPKTMLQYPKNIILCM